MIKQTFQEPNEVSIPTFQYFPEYQSECYGQVRPYIVAPPFLLPCEVKPCYIPFIRGTSAAKYGPVKREHGIAERPSSELYNLSRYPVHTRQLTIR